jgi:hypothetical protein
LPAVTGNTDAGFVELGRKLEVSQDDGSVDEAAKRSYVAKLVGRPYDLDWPSLLVHRLVVVFRKPGCGKPAELRSQQRNPDSFFLRLEQRVSEDIDTILSKEELDRIKH